MLVVYVVQEWDGQQWVVPDNVDRFIFRPEEAIGIKHDLEQHMLRTFGLMGEFRVVKAKIAFEVLEEVRDGP